MKVFSDIAQSFKSWTPTEYEKGVNAGIIIGFIFGVLFTLWWFKL